MQVVHFAVAILAATLALYQQDAVGDGRLAHPLNGRLLSQPNAGHVQACIAALALRDDPDCFRVVFDYFWPKLRAYFAARLPPDSVEDCVQEVIVTIWRTAADYDPARGEVGAWVSGIARNVLLRERRSLAHLPVPLGDDLPEMTAADCPLCQAIGAEERRVLLEAMRRLASQDAALLVEHYFRGATHRELASRLGMPLGTLKGRLRQAIAALRRMLLRRR